MLNEIFQIIIIIIIIIEFAQFVLDYFNIISKFSRGKLAAGSLSRTEQRNSLIRCADHVSVFCAFLALRLKGMTLQD
jgi:hypothetical protein